MSTTTSVSAVLTAAKYWAIVALLATVPVLGAELVERPAGWGPGYPACAPHLTCFHLTPYFAKNYTFNCSSAGLPPNAVAKGNVYFMHGNDGPNSKAMWALMMVQLAAQGYNTLACDQRGFSPGASPYNVSEYNYDYLVEDIFALSDKYFGVDSKIHAVGHDQGGRVGWHAIAVGTARKRYASYTALSEAHSDVFSDALFGPNPDPVQQTNFMYVWDFTLPGENVLAYHGAMQHNVCGKIGYRTTKECQTALWWYPGAISSGNLALPPKKDFGYVGKMIGIPDEWVKEHAIYPWKTGIPQTAKVGNVTEFPVLLICGSSDLADLCTDRYKEGTAALVQDFSYYRATKCGHDLTTPKACSQYQDVIDAVVTVIKSVPVV